MPTIEVGEPISQSFHRTGIVLFRPFSFKKWLAISVAAWLTLIGEGGGGTFNFNPSGGGGGGGGGRGGFDEALAWMNAHMALIIVGVIIVTVIGFMIYLLYRWLNSRGQFMLFDHVVNDSSGVGEAWARQRFVGNSLLKFRIGWDLVIFNAFLLIAVIAGALCWPDFKPMLEGKDYAFSGWTVTAIIFGILAAIIWWIAWWVLSSFLFHMVVPVMYVRQMRAWPAFKQTWREMFMPNFWRCMLYFLLMFVLGMLKGLWAAIGAILLALVTCCVFYLLFLLPLVGVFALYPLSLVSLPVLTYERVFMLAFIAQFGPEYQVNWVETPRGGFPVILNPPAFPAVSPGEGQIPPQ